MTTEEIKLHPLNQKWSFFSIAIRDRYYDEMLCNIPIENVEDLWEIVRKLPTLDKISGYNIAFFKDPFKPHYDDINTRIFTIRLDNRDPELFYKLIAFSVGGEFDHKVGEGFRGLYIIVKDRTKISYAFWFDPAKVEDGNKVKQCIYDEIGLQMDIDIDKLIDKSYMTQNK
ncbi:hypothetical protein TVAG_307000 [Trichomonas vaginalis G3]|uniref:Uncharacterized protein n=1 Tax=Trichomonas vaginalis (strain ATCC PRA-98 / G3) TaxID=412133 RepID=A2FTY7_TRIV3|nr:eIF4e-like family [Trichomonas vaginalis G3]EAX91624.1 hypothetical protein TVAG_307000 [Trichomonas vaginalis G3]KAI5513450.1 eIF4e-like family [Trichomonas vaginalis G3]|eukprot:XP_001304554.1 hypothetical protein [Trichomonas vaginalis G3]